MAEHPITPLILQLTEANRIATEKIATNSDFNRTIQASLAGINTQITQITQGIRDMQTRLSDSERQIGENQATIEQNKAQNERLIQESETAIRDRDDTARELANLEKARLLIEEDYARQEGENTRRLKELTEERITEIAELRIASTDEHDRLQKDLDETNAKIARLTEDNQNIHDQSVRDLADLDGQRGDLQRELKKSRDEIQRIENVHIVLEENSETLRAENNRLKELLSNAIPQMQSAINNLSALSNATGQDEINGIIEQINSQLTEINNLLGVQGASVVASNSNGLSLDTRITFPNQNPTTLGEIIDALRSPDKYRVINWVDNVKQEILPLLDSATNEEEVIRVFEGYDKNALFRGINMSGGRKTRRRKTRKGRKTRKIKKQRGGYHYSGHARRRSITTSSKRISRRTKRSSRRTKRSSYL